MNLMLYNNTTAAENEPNLFRNNLRCFEYKMNKEISGESVPY